MNKLILLTFISFIYSCKDNQPATGTFGNAFDNKNPLTLSDAMSMYEGGKDTIYTIYGTIENVCKHKGCWISFKAADGKEFYINNDETFAMPVKAKGHRATAKGKFVKDEKGEIGFLMTGVIIE